MTDDQIREAVRLAIRETVAACAAAEGFSPVTECYWSIDEAALEATIMAKLRSPNA